MKSLLNKLNIREVNHGVCTGPGGWLSDSNGSLLTSFNPTTGEEIASVRQASAETYDQVVEKAQQTFVTWRNKPAPERG